MIAAALTVPPLDERPPHPLELPVRSLAALVKQRAQERDEALRERDTFRQMLSLTLTQLHDMTVSHRRLQDRLRQVLDARPGGYLDEQQRGYAA